MQEYMIGAFDTGIIKELRIGAVLRQYWNYFTGPVIQDIADFSAPDETAAKRIAAQIVLAATEHYNRPFGYPGGDVEVRLERFYAGWNDAQEPEYELSSRGDGIDFIFGTAFSAGCFEDSRTPVLLELENSPGPRLWILAGIH